MIAITPGEPGGIGPDLVIQAAQHDRSQGWVVVADAKMLEERAQLLFKRIDNALGGGNQRARQDLAIDRVLAVLVLDDSRRDLIRNSGDRGLLGILEAAARLFDDRDPVGLTLERIAKLAHVRENELILLDRNRLKLPAQHGHVDG